MTPPDLTPSLACARCGALIPPEDWNASGAIFCRSCRAPLTVLAFPALFARLAPPVTTPAGDGEAVCFYHPAKRAVVACDQCGRLLCSLCHVDFLGQNWCAGCIETHRRKGKLATLETSRTLYDRMALALAFWPLLVAWPFTVFTAPGALYLVIRYWRAPGSIVARWRLRFYLAAIVASLQIAAWLALVVVGISALL